MKPFYVIGDTHWFHDNIVGLCGRDTQIEWLVDRQVDEMLGINRLQRAGDRAPVIDHNEYMVERWNAVVGPDDLVLHVGDLCHWRKGGPERMERDIAPRLNGRKQLILGNHDKGDRAWYDRIGFEVISPFVTTINGVDVQFAHYPKPVWWGKPDDNRLHVHGHIHNNGYPLADGPDGWRQGTTQTAIGQINVSVEMIDYTPQPITKLIASANIVDDPDQGADHEHRLSR